MAISFALIRFAAVCRQTTKRPVEFVPQKCVNPRNVNVAGFPSPRFRRSDAAKRPNSISRVFSG